MEFDLKLQKDIKELKGYIDDCDFVTIDTELTGLNKGRSNFFDTSEMRYTFLKENAMPFTITQLGVCIFKFDESNKCFNFRPINFYIKPIKKDFLVNSDTIDFLNKSKFDYNRCFQDGVSYISYSDYLTEIENLERRKALSLENLNSSTEFTKFSHLKDLISQCREFLENESKDEFFIDSSSSELDKNIILFELWKEIGCVNGKWIYVTKEKEERNFKVKKSVDIKMDLEKLINDKFSKYQEKLTNDVKISEFVKYIGESKKILVVHNGFLDILHIYDKFIEPLPEKWLDFKEKFHALFPSVFDTKHIFCNDKFKEFRSNYLEGIYVRTKEEPFQNPDKICQAFSEEFSFPIEGSFHTAHYDAMITGKIFVSLAIYLNNNNINFHSNGKFQIPPVLNKHNNRIKTVNSDVAEMNFNPSFIEKKCNRNRVFHMTIPKQWNRHNIVLFLFAMFGGNYKDLYDNVDIKWLSSESLNIRLPDSVDINKVENVDSDSQVEIVSFNQYYNISDDAGEVDEDGFVKVKRRRRN